MPCVGAPLRIGLVGPDSGPIYPLHCFIVTRANSNDFPHTNTQRDFKLHYTMHVDKQHASDRVARILLGPVWIPWTNS